MPRNALNRNIWPADRKPKEIIWPSIFKGQEFHDFIRTTDPEDYPPILREIIHDMKWMLEAGTLGNFDQYHLLERDIVRTAWITEYKLSRLRNIWQHYIAWMRRQKTVQTVEINDDL